MKLTIAVATTMICSVIPMTFLEIATMIYLEHDGEDCPECQGLGYSQYDSTACSTYGGSGKSEGIY